MKLKPIFYSLSVAVFCLMVFGGTAAGDTLSPYYPLAIGTTDDLAASGQGQTHQDTLSNVNWLVDNYTPASWLSDSFSLPENLTLLGKYENKNGGYWEDNAAWGSDSPYFTITSNWWDTKGYWEKISDTFSGPVYFSVKASNAFALFYAEDLTWSYWNTFWTTAGNTHNNHYNAMSHISFWTAGGPDSPDTPAPVPEPATLLLVGMGILGLARAGRKYMS